VLSVVVELSVVIQKNMVQDHTAQTALPWETTFSWLLLKGEKNERRISWGGSNRGGHRDIREGTRNYGEASHLFGSHANAHWTTSPFCYKVETFIYHLVI